MLHNVKCRRAQGEWGNPMLSDGFLALLVREHGGEPPNPPIRKALSSPVLPMLSLDETSFV
jgi:hypothetical protein